LADGKLFSVVTTTINVPTLLEAYARDAVDHDRRVEQIVVVGDRKTPPEAERFCVRLEHDTGVRVNYLGVAEQEDYLARRPAFRDFLPWNCIQRRNVGLLVAYDGEADIVVTIDDDNFIEHDDYLGRHAHLGDELELEAVEADSGWWNVCTMLEEARGIPFYHRGHPLSQRWNEGEWRTTAIRARAVVNAGLWLDDPDVDAVTRLCFPVCATGPSDRYRDRLALAPGTWAPFNSQNTALLRELIPAYLLFPHIGRYDDIWASYVIRHIADARGDLVTYGAPLVRQERNPHDYFKDLDAERFGLEANDVFLDGLRSCTLSTGDYAGAYAEIAEQFPERISHDPRFDKVAEGFRLWAGMFSD
jgi:glycosyltransferase involved in cell wall biosynthesis